MKRSARIAKAKGGGGSGAAATPGADDGDDRARAEKKDYIADNPVWRKNRNQRFVDDGMAGLRIRLGFSMFRFDSFTTHFFHIHGHISYFPI